MTTIASPANYHQPSTSPYACTSISHLCLTSTSDGRHLRVRDLAGAATAGLDGLDDPQGLIVGDLAEDDVLAVEPAGDDGGDEELGTVAVGSKMCQPIVSMDVCVCERG